ncbi:MAG: hypothetical protein LBB16_00660 [Puniceicoccales bacterium]|jgi:DNA-binding FrmR family transcriptional regulator|nr:hypothetical protein [Puniceicoccales bacterium]
MDSGKKERPILVDMEKNLLEDKSGIYRKELINKLLQYESEVNGMIHDTNDDNDVFNRLNAVKTALQQAKYAIEKF